MTNLALFGGLLMVGLILMFADQRGVLPKRVSKLSKAVATVCIVSAAVLLVFT